MSTYPPPPPPYTKYFNFKIKGDISKNSDRYISHSTHHFFIYMIIINRVYPVQTLVSHQWPWIVHLFKRRLCSIINAVYVNFNGPDSICSVVKEALMHVQWSTLLCVQLPIMLVEVVMKANLGRQGSLIKICLPFVNACRSPRPGEFNSMWLWLWCGYFSPCGLGHIDVGLTP